MIEEITRFKTNDGKEFSDKLEAQEYVVDQIREYFAKKTNYLINTCELSSYREQYDFIISIIGSIDDVKELYGLLKKYAG